MYIRPIIIISDAGTLPVNCIRAENQRKVSAEADGCLDALPRRLSGRWNRLSTLWVYNLAVHLRKKCIYAIVLAAIAVIGGVIAYVAVSDKVS